MADPKCVEKDAEREKDEEDIGRNGPNGICSVSLYFNAFALSLIIDHKTSGSGSGRDAGYNDGGRGWRWWGRPKLFGSRNG